MPQDSGVFWTDIKEYEERLAVNPDSFCFARLAEIYLKVGLTDDALHAARKGVARHPSHIAGQRALALACHAKGLMGECREALEQVVAAVPEDTESLKLLVRLYEGSGNEPGAIRVLKTVLDLNPEDEECRLELKAMEGAGLQETGAGFAPVVERPSPSLQYQDSECVAFDEEEEIIEDLEILELDESDLVEEYPEIRKGESERAATVRHDPFSTTTLAELYVQQGFVSKALDIYHSILADDPANSSAQARIAELSAMGASANLCREDGARGASDDTETTAYTTGEMRFEPPPAAHVGADVVLQPQGAADTVLATLEKWLENIKRIKACR